MTKSHTTLTIDPELLDRAKEARINISASLEDTLRGMLIEHAVSGGAGKNIRVPKALIRRAKKYIDLDPQVLPRWVEIINKRCSTKLTDGDLKYLVGIA